MQVGVRHDKDTIRAEGGCIPRVTEPGGVWGVRDSHNETDEREISR